MVPGGLFLTEAGRELLAVNRTLYNPIKCIINNLESLDDLRSLPEQLVS